MTDRITGIEDTTRKDRLALNVGGRSSGKKATIIVLFLIVAVAVLLTGLYFSFNALSTDTVVDVNTDNTDNNFIAGADISRIGSGDGYFENIKKQMDRDKSTTDPEDVKITDVQDTVVVEAPKLQVPLIRPKVVTRSPQPKLSQPKPTAIRSSNNGNKDQPISPAQRKMQGNVVVNISDGKTISEAPTAFSKNFNASSFEDGYATLRKERSLDFLLIHGTSLPCALYTQIISDYEGFVTCRITQDVYSADGAALLVEKGSVVSGTQSVAMEQGKARIFTSWADIETPLGASIRIDSLGTGQLGAAGIDAWIDNHFKQRFGGAILLSFVDDALGALSNEIASDTGVSTENTANNVRDMASQALESSINIKPTGYAFIGQRINILVARDIDMSSIYRFESEE
jgi:type IV secretion system protein VirB10